jgi:hypothetical protein
MDDVQLIKQQAVMLERGRSEVSEGAEYDTVKLTHG